MTELLAGTISAGGSNAVDDYVLYCQYTAVASGNIEDFRVYSLISGAVKVGLYSDDGDEPDTRIAYNDSGQSVSADQWNILSISSTPIVASTKYWLACIGDIDGNHSYAAGPELRFYYNGSNYGAWTWPETALLTGSAAANTHALALYGGVPLVGGLFFGRTGLA